MKHCMQRLRTYGLTLIILGIFDLGFSTSDFSIAGPDSSIEISRDIYVPYQDLVQLIEPAEAAILMDRDEFEKLLAAAEANTEAADTLELGQVKQADYSVKVSGEEMLLTGKLQVFSMSERPLLVPMGFAQVGLTSVHLDNKPAPLGYDKQGRLSLVVSGKGSHQLKVTGSTKLKELSTGGMQFSISLPAAVAGKMDLSAAGDCQIHATVPVSKPVYDKQADRTNVELTIGGQDRLTIVLLGNGRQEDEQAILLGESAATINLTRSNQVMSCLYTVQVLRRGVRQLRFLLPSQWTITEVTCPTLVRWSVDEAEYPQGEKTLTVSLRSAKVGTTALHIKATAFRGGRMWHGPRIILAEAAFQRGYLMVNTDEELRVRAEKLTDARREDAAAASVPGILSTSIGRLYFHWGNNWSLDLELATVALRRSIKEQQKLLVTPKYVTLTADFEVTAIDRELFDISFVLPAQVRQWQLRTVQVNNQQTGFEYRVEDQADKRLLRIELARPVLPEKLANVKIVLQHVPSNWHWPSDAPQRTIIVPLIESLAETVSGHISVSAGGDLDTMPTNVPDELEQVPVGRMASLGLTPEVKYAYTYKAPLKGQIRLQVSRLRPRLAAEAVGLVTTRPQGLTGDWRINYDISRASARRIYLLIDKSLEEKIKITSPSARISSKNIVPADEKTMPLSSKLTRRYNLWLLNLDHACSGEVVVDVHYERPLANDSIQVPLVRPICRGQLTEHLAIQAGEELALEITAANVKEIDAIDLPPLPVSANRILAAFRLQAATTPDGSDAAVTLTTAVHENYRVPSALAVSSRLTTYLDAQGWQRTEAIFRIANAGRQFLTFRLPHGAELWSLSVAGRQAKPQRSTQGDYQLPLARSREPVPIRIVYACCPANARLERIQLGGVEIPGVEMNKVRWIVVPPPGYLLTTQQTKMQTADLIQPIPAYVQLYNFLTDNLFQGSLLMPSLTRVQRFPKRVAFARVKAERAAGMVSTYAEEDEQAYRQQLAKEAPPKAAELTMAKPVTQMAVAFRPAKEGRFTLPVDLVPTAGAGPAAGFTGLGTAKLIIGLSRRPRQTGWWLVGFILIMISGVLTAMKKAKVKATLFVAVLSVASLMAIWWPATTHFANGVFIAGFCLLPLYILIAFIRWLWPKLRFGDNVGSKVVTMLLLVLILSCSGQTANAAEPTQVSQSSARPVRNSRNEAEPSKRSISKRARPTDDNITLPPIIIPYEGDPTTAEKSKKVLIPYTRFVKLWNQAHPEDPIDGLKPGTDISLADVHYKATVEQQQLKLLLTADIRTYGRDWVVLALPFQGLAVTEVTLDGKPAQWQGVPASGEVAAGESSRFRIRNSKTGMVLMLAGGISGKLELAAVAQPRYFGRRGSVSFSLPPLPAAVMTVVLPQEDLQLEVDEIDGTLTHRTVNGKAEWTVPLAMTRELTLRWLPKTVGGAADRTLSAISNHDVYAFHWAIVAVTRITYGFSAGEHDRFAVCLPVGAALTDLKGANIRDYRQVGEKLIKGRTFKTIEVRLHRPAKKQYELTVRWLAELPSLDEPSRLFLVRAGDVSRESGTVTLHTAGGMTLKVAGVSGGRRVSIDSPDAELTETGAQPVARYYWPYRPFSLSVQLSRPEVSPKANLDQLVRIGTDRVQLLIQAVLKTDRGRLFGANFALPNGYELLSVVGPVVENFYERSTANGRFLHVKFISAEQETTMALVLVRSEPALDDFQVPTVMPIDAEGNPLPEQQGRLAVQVAASLDARTVSSRNIKSIPPRTLRNWLDENQMDRVQFAYKYEVPNPSLLLHIRRQPTHIRVQTFAGLVVKATAAAYTYRLRYDITGSPIDHLRFQMPTEYAPLVAVQSPAMRSVTQSDAGAGRTSWDVALVNEVTGTVDVTVNFALPIDASTKLLTIPRIETTAPAGYRAIVAVQNISRHDITVKNKTNLEELPVSEQRELIPSQMRQSLQYVFHSFKDNWSLSLDFRPAKPAARIQAVVDLLALTTVIDRSGRCRYEAKVALQNRSEQFLTVQLPHGLRLWSATVAGQPVKPVMAANSPQAEILIPLVKTSPGGLPYDVYLYFADDGAEPLVEPLNGITRLKPPGISIVGMPVTQTTWSLRLPGGYRYMRPGGNMSPVTGTVEMLSLGIEARLKQLKRLDKTYREIAGSSTEREEITQQNWEEFNIKLTTEIRHAKRYLDANRDEVAKEDYKRLRSKLSEQGAAQTATISGNTAYVQRQQERATSNLNVLFNDSAVNFGVAEGHRNGALLQKPEFITENERRQIERLQQELEASEQQRKGLALQVQQAREGDTFTVTGGAAGRDMIIVDADKKAEMGKILEQLSEESAAQIDMKQTQIKRQLSELADGRAQRYFQKGAQMQQAPAKAKREDKKLRWPRPPKDRAEVRARRVRGAEGDTVYDKSRVVRPEETKVLGSTPSVEAAGEQILPYVARGTYSLPVTLPEGQVRLDFARPSGQAKLTIWAVPVTMFHTLYASLTVLTALAVLVGAIKIWPQHAKRPPISVKRIIIYVAFIVALTLLLGLLGLLISLAVILLIETTRAAYTHRAVAAQS